jgi:hypothetical protein
MLTVMVSHGQEPVFLFRSPLRLADEMDEYIGPGIVKSTTQSMCNVLTRFRLVSQVDQVY